MAVKISAWKYISLVVPGLALMYGIGDGAGWWDRIFGRDQANSGLSRLSTGEGFPTTYICFGEPEFPAMERIISGNTGNAKLQGILREGHRPVMISTVYYPMLRLGDKDRPADWPDFRTVPDATPIVYVFIESEDKRKSFPSNCEGLRGQDYQGKLTWAATLGDLRHWINEEKSRERYWVSTVLIGLLSVIVAFLGVRSS